jgi:hypothetical protein
MNPERKLAGIICREFRRRYQARVRVAFEPGVIYFNVTYMDYTTAFGIPAKHPDPINLAISADLRLRTWIPAYIP